MRTRRPNVAIHPQLNVCVNTSSQNDAKTDTHTYTVARRRNYLVNCHFNCRRKAVVHASVCTHIYTQPHQSRLYMQSYAVLHSHGSITAYILNNLFAVFASSRICSRTMRPCVCMYVCVFIYMNEAGCACDVFALGCNVHNANATDNDVCMAECM